MATDSQQNQDQQTTKPEDLVSEPMNVVSQPEPEKTLLSWKSPARLYKKRNREYFTTIGVIVLLLSVILLFAKEFLLVGVILALAFVAYVLASVAPPEVEHVLTNKGVRTGGKLYPWQLLGRFWLETKWGQDSLMVENLLGFPGHLVLLLPKDIDRSALEKTMSSRLLKEKPSPSPIDKAAEWLQRKVPLETE